MAPGALGVLLASGVALGQGPKGEPGQEAPAASGSPTASAAPASTAPARPMGGYSYGQAKPANGGQKVAAPPASRGKTRHVQKTAAGPVATLPGFELLGDGGSRVFVELTQNVPVEERKAKGSLTYVLKGAHVAIHNNTNPLVTVHFNTPVTKAQLRPAGRDVLLVIDLRAAVAPAWTIAAAKDGTAVLQIDFAKGKFVPAGGEQEDTPKSDAKPSPGAKGKS